jgi:uncharacterized protein (TIGR02270 family)
MQDVTCSRIAGEAFTTITGLELDEHGLATDAPQGLVEHPSDHSEDEDVSMDEDEYLPWPDVEKIRALWKVQGRGFTRGIRYFCGQPVDPALLQQRMPELRQRQRYLAALELALADTSTPCINTHAKAST